MKRPIFTSILLVILTISACRAPASPSTPELIAEAGGGSDAPALTEAPLGKQAAPSFEALTYLNETVGFALEYPASWSVSDETVIGTRGSQVLFLSSPDLAEAQTIPTGETRLTIQILQWDPRNDLRAFTETRKTAWSASGFMLGEETPLILELGLEAVMIPARDTVGTPILYLLTALDDNYLVISGEGDLALAEQLMLRLRAVGK